MAESVHTDFELLVLVGGGRVGGGGGGGGKRPWHFLVMFPTSNPKFSE